LFVQQSFSLAPVSVVEGMEVPIFISGVKSSPQQLLSPSQTEQRVSIWRKRLDSAGSAAVEF